MKLSFVLGGVKGLRYPFTINGEWDHTVIPHKGDMIEGETIFKFGDWNMISKDDFINLGHPTEEILEYYNESINNGETHAQGMRWLLIEHLGGMYYVDDVTWRTENEMIYPEIWLCGDSNCNRTERKLDEILRIVHPIHENGKQSEDKGIKLSQGIVIILISIFGGTIIYWIFAWIASMIKSI